MFGLYVSLNHLFQDHHVIPQGDTFVKHDVIQRSGFDIQSASNRLHIPSHRGLADILEVTVHPGGPLKSYESGNRGNTGTVYN
jgi:hypothetical protein